MMKKTFLILGIIIIIIAGLGLWYLDHKRKTELSEFNKLNGYSLTDVPGDMTQEEAKAIAEKSCIKGGEALGTGLYNTNSKTWWFDANLNARPEGCNPACVVSDKTKIAEINWRCTGLKN